MIKRSVTPLTELDRRVPEAGRIRMGVKVPITTGKNAGKSRPRGLDTWRFTSQHRDLIEAIAAHYGGEARPWHDDTASPADQFEVITEANSIRVLVVPDGISIWYELWAAGGCKRRCDGIEVESPQLVGESDYEMVKAPCICHEQGMAECDPHTRLLVLLPEFSFMGAWRFESKGWNAAQELPGMYDMISEVHARGSMIDAMLSIASEERMTPTGKRNFKKPKLTVRQTVLEIAAGAAGLQQLGGGGTPVEVRPALNAAPRFAPSTPGQDDIDLGSIDDGITEAELVSDEEIEIIALLKADARNFNLDPDAYVAGIRAGSTDEATGTLSLERFREYSRRARAGEIEPLGLKANGRVQWRP